MTDLQKVTLTDELLNSIDFRYRVMGIGFDGKPMLEPTPPGMTDWFIRDAILPGFAVRVTGKAYPGRGEGIAFYAQRKLAGRPCRYKCGEWPETSIRKARDIAAKALGLMANGQDPNLEKKKAKAEVVAHRQQAKLTFGFIVARDAANRQKADSEKTIQDRKDVAKWMSDLKIWNMPIKEVDADSLQDAIDALRQKRGDSSAVKCWRYCRAAWNRLPANEMPPVDPFAEWQKSYTLPAVKRRQTAMATDEAQGKTWLSAIAELRNAEGSRGFSSRVMADYILMALCWGARRGEASRIKLQDVDFEREFVVFRETKNSRDHYFPLTPGCAFILKNRIADNALPRGRDARKAKRGESIELPEWIFPSAVRGKHLVEPRSALGTAATASGLKISMHDLRRTFAGEIAVDVMEGNTGGDFGLVKLAMNHADMANDVTQGYITIKANLRRLRPIYEAHERRVFEAAGLSALLPAQADDVDQLIEKIRAKAADPEALKKIMEALGG